jgi:hypothetical protein
MGTLNVYAAHPRRWDDSEVAAIQACSGEAFVQPGRLRAAPGDHPIASIPDT